MFRNDFCIINENVHRRHRRTHSQFLRYVIHEEDKSKAINAHDIVMSHENSMIKEQKLQNQLCDEIKQLKQKQFREEQRKVILHRNEEEVRELDAQINRAYIQRDLIKQKAFKRNKLKEDMQARIEENKRFEEECKRNKEIALEEEREIIRRKTLFRQDLLKQIQEKEERKKLEREVVAKEREGRQRFLETIQQDDANEKQTLVKLKEMLKQEKDQYLRKVELYKKQMAIDTQKDAKEYEERTRKREEEKRLRCEKRKQALQERAALSERTGLEVLALEREKQRRHDVLLELLIGERLAKDDERYKINIEKQAQTARSLRDDFQRYFAKKQNESHFKREKEKIAIQEQLKIVQDLELKNIAKKTLKLSRDKQSRQDFLNAFECKSWDRRLIARENKTQYEQHLALQKNRQQEIEAEKLRILRAQPLEILKLLPVKAINDDYRALLGLTSETTKQNNFNETKDI